jgi:hypothetical protein
MYSTSWGEDWEEIIISIIIISYLQNIIWEKGLSGFVFNINFTKYDQILITELYVMNFFSFW